MVKSLLHEGSDSISLKPRTAPPMLTPPPCDSYASLLQEPDSLDSLKMEVGIEDCLHIEFEYDKSAYHLQDVVIGKVRPTPPCPD